MFLDYFRDFYQKQIVKWTGHSFGNFKIFDLKILFVFCKKILI
ncbi:hypothetical protein LEP1GSC082_1396 [Leptospira kirschneri str. H2]|uniref:Uncharacterized protein n=1 Tax=Leptospira kirschneri str. H1 TaxID=1049966 RepID=A0A0E2B457_9LEPT|nr:hypothetical protein LEP1GSC081_4234 [Leptospira kirschneri str. H1]EKO59873.1 hypothetical protein LEP1GSC082_1396 [Leptospira kirschneri str. H2]EMJ93429.1 hypothetical protein LEP1GSC198_2488 [Leptospira kirschneri str. JB]EMK04659.1 hypothetical protein LEP1GSC166_2200 [Leptospira kirschneri]